MDIYSSLVDIVGTERVSNNAEELLFTQEIQGHKSLEVPIM